MNRRQILILIIIPTVIVILLVLLNLYVKHKIEDHLEESFSGLTYESLDVNIFSNRYRLEEVQARQPQFSLGAKNVIFKGISYSSLLSNGEIIIDQLEMQEPKIIYYEGAEAGGKVASEKQVKIGEIHLRNGTFSRKDNDSSTNNLHLKFPEVELKFRNKNVSDFDVGNYRVELDSVFLKMNEEHYISTGSVEAENGKVGVSDFAITSFYSKDEFDRNIPYEKDRIDLKVPRISMENLNLEERNDTLYIEDSKMTISEAFLEIYRNKLNPDAPNRKPLYNELLREAPIKLNLQQVLVEKSEIIYEELVQEDHPAAVIRFTQVEGEINNLQNLSDSLPQPQITARANFMRGTIVSLNWTFPVFDPLNRFTVSGEFGEIHGEALDPFLIPAMDVQARGKIKEISFSFSGNEDMLEGNFAMDYESLKVELLKDEGKKKKNFLSALANLLVENEGEVGEQEKSISVERNKKRSFWNFLWLGLRQGFIEVVRQF